MIPAPVMRVTSAHTRQSRAVSPPGSGPGVGRRSPCRRSRPDTRLRASTVVHLHEIGETARCPEHVRAHVDGDRSTRDRERAARNSSARSSTATVDASRNSTALRSRIRSASPKAITAANVSQRSATVEMSCSPLSDARVGSSPRPARLGGPRREGTDKRIDAAHDGSWCGVMTTRTRVRSTASPNVHPFASIRLWVTPTGAGVCGGCEHRAEGPTDPCWMAVADSGQRAYREFTGLRALEAPR